MKVLNDEESFHALDAPLYRRLGRLRFGLDAAESDLEILLQGQASDWLHLKFFEVAHFHLTDVANDDWSFANASFIAYQEEDGEPGFSRYYDQDYDAFSVQSSSLAGAILATAPATRMWAMPKTGPTVLDVGTEASAAVVGVDLVTGALGGDSIASVRLSGDGIEMSLTCVGVQQFSFDRADQESAKRIDLIRVTDSGIAITTQYGGSVLAIACTSVTV